jgi:carboxylesterase type B
LSFIPYIFIFCFISIFTGFLRTGDTNAVGNYALWDLVAILFWVQQNIDRFGGDAGRVTLFGHGHGAALVNFLLFTKTAKEKSKFICC